MRDKTNRRKWKRYVGAVILFVVTAVITYVFGIMPSRLGRELNPTLVAPPYTVSAETQAFHDSLLVADLHADSLLWCRDISRRSSWGHVDIPRLREGNVGIQAFTAVTKSPEGQNMKSNSAEAKDRITNLVIAQRWPVRTWFSLRERALYQAQRLTGVVAEDENLILVRTASDVTDLVTRRMNNKELLGVFLGIEGLHCLEGNLDTIQVFYDAGFRMMAPTHFFDNEMGGSAHGESKSGLTDFGREAVARMDALHIIIDLAHASVAMIDDILATTTRPVLVSHTGVRGTCDNVRNLSDEHVRAIADGGGLIGIGIWDTAICGDDVAATAAAMKYTSDLVGIEHVAIGSDFDGVIDAPFDATGYALLTQALLDAGFSNTEVIKLMGGNTAAFLARALPEN